MDEEGEEVVGAPTAGGGVRLGFHWGGFIGARGSVSGVERGGEVDEEGKEEVDGEAGAGAPVWSGPQGAGRGRGCQLLSRVAVLYYCCCFT